MDDKRNLPPLAPRAWLRWDRVGPLLDDLDPRTVLEIGCGQGGFGARIAARPGVSYLGVEPDAASCHVARARIEPRGGTVLPITDGALPQGKQFDLVCAFEVLEHLEHDQKAVDTWATRVAPGGALVVSVPAWQERFGPMDTAVGHYRRYSPDELADILRAAGLTEVSTTLYGWPLGYPMEWVRNRMDAKALAGLDAGVSPEQLTEASGRHQQPSRRLVGSAIGVGTWPFRLLQRAVPSRGTGLIAVARAPR